MSDQLALENKTYPVPERLSPSAIDTLFQCPLKFKLNRLENIWEPPSEEALMGSFVHDILERLLKVEPPEDRTLERAREISKQAWEDKWEKKAKGVVTDPDWKWKAWWCVETYFGMEDPASINAQDLEQMLQGSIDGVTIRGILDRWMIEEDGAFVITDYKTGKVPPPEYQDDKLLQLSIYAYLLAQKIEHPIDFVEWMYVKEGKRIRRQVTDTDQQIMIDTVRRAQRELEERCATGDFPPKTSKLCDWCMFKTNGMCPAWT